MVKVSKECYFLFEEKVTKENFRNRNARINLHPACHKFRCWNVAAFHRNLTPSIDSFHPARPAISRPSHKSLVILRRRLFSALSFPFRIRHFALVISPLPFHICRFAFAISHLSFRLCHFTFAVSHSPFRLCHFTFAVSHLPFRTCHFAFAISHLPFRIAHSPRLRFTSADGSADKPADG